MITHKACFAASRLVVACVLICCFSNNASSGDTTSAASTTNQANQLLNEQFGPFKLSFGQQDSGGFGANLNGDGRKDFGSLGGSTMPVGGPNRPWFFPFSYFSYDVTGSWGSTQSATNNASISLKPGTDGVFFFGHVDDPSVGAILPITCDDNGTNCKDASGKLIGLISYPNPYFGAGASGDVELRYGTFKQNTTTSNIREFLVGGQVYFVALRRDWDFGIGRVLAAPRISMSYYHPTTANGTNDISLPPGVKVNYIQTEFETVMGFGGSHVSAVKFDVKYDGSEPTNGGSRSWGNLWTLKLWVPGLKFNGVNPTITYQSGKNGGFTYDRQVILGVLYEFLDPTTAKK